MVHIDLKLIRPQKEIVESEKQNHVRKMPVILLRSHCRGWGNIHFNIQRQLFRILVFPFNKAIMTLPPVYDTAVVKRKRRFI